MKVLVDEFYKELYESGHLDYALSMLARQDSVDEWVEWLQHEPIAMFTNTEDYKRDDSHIVYDDGDHKPEKYLISMIIELDNGDTLFHSAEGSQSMFYQLLPDDSVRAIYID